MSHESNCMTAFWQAIDNDADTSSAFAEGQKYKFSGELPRELTLQGDIMFPTYPALLAFPAMRDPIWNTHRMMRNMVTIEIRLYTALWEYTQAADLIDKVRLAVYTAAPSVGAEPYIVTATKFIPVKFGPIQYQPVALGDGKSINALRTTAPLVLQTRDDPLAR